MTEKTVYTDIGEVSLLRFLAALLAVPLATGGSAFAVTLPLVLLDVAAYVMPLSIPFAFVAFATVPGAPTFLLFGVLNRRLIGFDGEVQT